MKLQVNQYYYYSKIENEEIKEEIILKYLGQTTKGYLFLTDENIELIVESNEADILIDELEELTLTKLLSRIKYFQEEINSCIGIYNNLINIRKTIFNI